MARLLPVPEGNRRAGEFAPITRNFTRGAMNIPRFSGNFRTVFALDAAKFRCNGRPTLSAVLAQATKRLGL